MKRPTNPFSKIKGKKFKMKMNKYTPWIPLATWHYGGTDYMVFARMRLKTGMVYFKTKKVNNILILFNREQSIPTDLLDVKKQWEKLMSYASPQPRIEVRLDGRDLVDSANHKSKTT